MSKYTPVIRCKILPVREGLNEDRIFLNLVDETLTDSSLNPPVGPYLFSYFVIN